MNSFEGYLRQVVRRTYLSRREKDALIAEMQSHLVDSVENYRITGSSDEQAYQRALRSFGTPKELRQQIIRETFVISPRWFLTAAILCFLALFIALYTNMRFDDVVVTHGSPATWKQIPNPDAVTWLHRYFPLDSTRWGTLGTMCFMMIFTRKQADRLAVFVSWVPFCPVLLPGHVSLRTCMAGIQRIVFSALPVIQPVSIASICEYLMLIVCGVALYSWTRNRAVSLTPWLIWIIPTTCEFVWRIVQSTLWKWTHNPIFWGQAPVGWWDYWYMSLSLIVHLIGAAVSTFYVCRWIDAIHGKRVFAA
ncbi:MAG: permease prefix domain 1-containing protein [Alicyclobacillus sp.]|nr:permease prefix domain 1-containing protein [Alicyclobacillus sp.]